MHRTLLALTVGALLFASQPILASEEPPSTAATQCPRYASLMRSAAQALERGDRMSALERLREARVALDACSRTAAPGAGLARRSPELGSRPIG